MCAILPWQSLEAVIQVVQEGAKGILGNHLQAAMKTHTHMLAVLHVHALSSNHLVTKDCTQSIRDEHTGRVNLHHPGEAFPSCLFLYVFPNVHEDQCIDKDLGVRPTNSCSIGVPC